MLQSISPVSSGPDRAIGEGMVYPITQLFWTDLFESYIDPVFLENRHVVDAGIPVSFIRTEINAQSYFTLTPLTVIPHDLSPDFELTNGHVTLYVEAKSSAIEKPSRLRATLSGRVHRGAAQILVRKSSSRFGIVVVSCHAGASPFVHVGVVAFG